MTKIEGEVRASGGVEGTGSAGFVLNATAEPALASLRFRLKDAKIFAAEVPFEIEGRKFNAGSFFIPTAGNPEDLLSRLKSATESLGLRAHAVSSEPTVKHHPVVAAPDRPAPHLGQHSGRRLVPARPGRMRNPLRLHLGPGCPRHARPESEVRRDYLPTSHFESSHALKRRQKAPARRRLRLRRPGAVQIHRTHSEPGRRRRIGRYPRRPGPRGRCSPQVIRRTRRRVHPDHRERRTAGRARHDRARLDQ